jgi:hypothetical protein
MRLPRPLREIGFETTDPALRGKMTITIAFADTDEGTDIYAVQDRSWMGAQRRSLSAHVARVTEPGLGW